MRVAVGLARRNGGAMQLRKTLNWRVLKAGHGELPIHISRLIYAANIGKPQAAGP